MDLVAEIFLEILGEAIIEGGACAASDRRRPKWQRVSILSLVVSFFAAVFVSMAAAGVIMLTDGRPAAAVLMLALSLGLIVLSGCKLRKILRTFSHE